MRIINTNQHPVQVLLRKSDNTTDYVHVMPRGRVDIADEFVVDPNWAVANPEVKLVQHNTEAK